MNVNIWKREGFIMVKFIYDNNIIIYTFAGLCGLGLLVRFILDLVYIYLVRETDNLGLTKNKMLKHMKMRFETCYRLNIGVKNVDTFVDKNLTKHRFCGILLSTWENFSGQVLLLSFLIIPISAIFGVVFDVEREKILYTGAVGILAGAALILADKMTNLSVKKQRIRINLLDYLENFCKVRLEHEALQPEKLEQFRKEYLSVIGEKNPDAEAMKKREEKKARRLEKRKQKEEEKKLRALKKQEEQKRLEQARKEAELKRLEERKKLAAKRREEEMKRLQKEQEELKTRREELRRMAEEKQRLKELRQQEKEEKERLLMKMEEELYAKKKDEEKQVLESIEEAAAELEKTGYKGLDLTVMTPEEEKLIEDVLREFFA